MSYHWNYRLVQHEDHVSMIEAHYENGRLTAWADAGPVIGNDVEDFTGELANRAKALDAPVIPVTYLNELQAEADDDVDKREARKAGFDDPAAPGYREDLFKGTDLP